MKTMIVFLAAFLAVYSLQAQNFWQQVNGPYGFAYFNPLASNASGHIFAAYEHVFRSTDNGENWTVVDSGLPASWFSTEIAISPDGIIFLGLADRSAGGRNSLFRSTNNGDSWFASDSGLGSAWVWDIAFASNGSIFLASGSDLPLARGEPYPLAFGMYRSTNGGRTWEHVGLLNVFSFAITDRGVILANDQLSNFDCGHFRSTDNGNTWQTTSLPTGCVQFTRNSDDHIFALRGWSSPSFRSTDEGITWSPFGTIPIRAIAFNASGEIFVGNQTGAFRSTDKGVTWSSINGGLTNPYVQSLEITANGFLFAAGYSGGTGALFRSVNPITDVGRESAGLPTTFSLEQNYPNPFNPSTKIAFSIPVGTGDAPSVLKVYDILGREVRTLVNGNLQAGSYEITFNADGLASGVYLYRLQAGKFVQTRKLVLVH